MKTSFRTALALACALSALAPMGAASEGKKAASAMLLPTMDIKWQDVPDFPGVKIAVLDGDPAKGPCHLMFKFAEGFAAPLHRHSSDHFATVVSGTLSLTVDGKETLLPAGSYFVFKGKKEHMTKCGPGGECVLSVDVRGPWDVIPEKSDMAMK